MGVKGLLQFVKKEAPGSIGTTPLSVFKGETIIIDASFRVFHFITACKKMPVTLTDSAKNSINFGLIGLSGNNLYLNKVNVITSYDFNGNKIKSLKTYDLLNYQKMVVGDSILALSKQLYTLYRLEPSGKLTEIQNGGNLRPISTIDEVRLADSVLVVLGNRYTSPKQQLDDIYDAELILVIVQNPGTNHPRMLTALDKYKENGGKSIAINPLPEAG